VLAEGGDVSEGDGDETPGDELLGYRASELAHDEYCYAHDHGHLHAIDFRNGNRQ
jgi:hypothetical protein